MCKLPVCPTNARPTYKSFHCFAVVPKSYVMSAFGVRLEVKSAVILIESVSASPRVKLPPIKESPTIWSLEPLITEPLTLELAIFPVK